MVELDQLLADQQDYYRARAADWAQWIRHYMEPVESEFDQLLSGGPLRGDVLDMACGTGYWTERLSRVARSVTALDGSQEMLDRIGERGLANVDTIRADLFAWNPPTQWDGVFMAHWLAHVPEERLKAFWGVVDAAVLPGGQVVVIDVTEAEKRIEEDVRNDDGLPLTRRRLKDGRKFDVVKKYWEPGELLAQLQELGWSGTATPVGADRGYGFVHYLLERTAS